MRKLSLSFPLGASLALAISLVPVSCGKKQSAAKGKVPSKGAPSAQSTSNDKDATVDQSNQAISGGQIVMVQNIVFKTGDLTSPFTGLVIWKHSNGKRQMESRCEAGVWNGPSKWWYKNETLAGEGIYKQGKWEGDYKEWHENSRQKVQITFKDGKEEGKEIWWYENGKYRSVTPYKNGKKEGKAEGYFESGAKSWEANWAGNSPNGEYKQWYENGNMKSLLRYVKGARHGKEEHWYQQRNDASQGDQNKAKEISWFKNKKQGVERHWYPSGMNMKAITYENGVMHGQAATFYENGRQADLRVFQNGKETYRRQWDQNGKLMVDGPVGQPKGRTHLWTQQTITTFCKGKTPSEIETLFGKADGAGSGGAWMYRGIKVVNPTTKQPIAATVLFTIQAGKVVQTKITAK